jgi:hypothetical protein
VRVPKVVYARDGVNRIDRTAAGRTDNHHACTEFQHCPDGRQESEQGNST